MESTTLPFVIYDRVCERFVDYDANSVLPKRLTRNVALDTDIVRRINFSNSDLTKLAVSHMSFCMVESLENLTRCGHINATSSA
jgi:hypothetical protein